ncbi:MAG: prepilin-type N-terminal cleavage/methylation domain-containing protein [Gemmatimonadetes bacterium]|nr:prepilin-type N-terminal cleavage/methylation domain-containing protein [Gemmatimonadota bacterium]
MNRKSFLRANGFTLIELMIVVVIIGILASIAVPKFMTASYRAKEKEAETILKQVYTVQRVHLSQNGAFASTVADLQRVGFEVPPNISYYAFNTAVGVSPYCLSVDPPGANHEERCIDLDTGAIN